ncbi:hypothetical protein ACHAXT_003445 [Thalassiosira profunda]
MVCEWSLEQIVSPVSASELESIMDAALEPSSRQNQNGRCAKKDDDAPSSSSAILDVPHASPPQSPGPLSPPTMPRKRPSQSSSLLRIIGVAIVFVLAFHWYLVLHHVTFHAPRGHHPSFLPGWEHGKGGAKKWTGGGGAKSRNKGGKEPYILSEVCGGCYRTYANVGKETIPCHYLIQQHQREHAGTSLREASKSVAQEHRKCDICNPDTCHGRYLGDSSAGHTYQTKYWRFDRTGPEYTNPTALVFPSIPDELRVPPEKFDDVESFLKERYANPDPENTTSAVLFEYNPGLAKLPEKVRAYLPWNARYLLSLRVTPHNFCWGEWLTKALHEDVKQTMHSLNYLGLALLDERYRVLPGYDVVIDIDKQLDAKRNSYMGEPPFVDYRLFTMNDEVYLHVNSDTVILTKLRLTAKGMGKDLDELEAQHEELKPFKKLKNLYGGDQLEVAMVHQFNTVWGEGKGSIFGKNYALFTLPNATHPREPDAIYAEMSVYPEHMVQRILPDEFEQLPRDRRIKWRQRRNFKIDGIIQRKVVPVGNATLSTSEKGKPVPSFFTADEHWFPGQKNPFKEFAHGGACCVSLPSEDLPSFAPRFDGVDSLFVGVGHTLVKYYSKGKMAKHEAMLVPDTNYVSFLYAFDPRPPYEVLARSGYFCLGFASESADDEGGTRNPHSILTHNRPLQQNNETFACPQIHYIETIIEKADDPSSVVIGYGLNDCTARIVEVEKKEIARLLFPDPLDMVASKT